MKNQAVTMTSTLPGLSESEKQGRLQHLHMSSGWLEISETDHPKRIGFGPTNGFGSNGNRETRGGRPVGLFLMAPPCS